MGQKRVLVLGVDGGTWAALGPYMDEGVMPNLGRILDASAHGTLRSTIPPITAPAWTSFATGVNPGRHGCYYFLALNLADGGLRPITSEDIKVETFYETLVRNGYKCTLINLPVSYPSKIERTVITSLLSRGDDIFSPPHLPSEIPVLKDYEIIPKEMYGTQHGEFPHDSDLIIENESVRFEAARELFQREWDVFFLLFSGSDWISHRAFAQMLSGEGAKAKGARDYFGKLDGWINWFFENSNGDTLKVVVSDHGFKVRKGYFAVNSWLEQKGLLRYREGVDSLWAEQKELPFGYSPARTGKLKPSVARLRDAVKNSPLASRMVPALKRMFERPGRLRKMVASDYSVDFKQSRAFYLDDGVFVRNGGGDSSQIVDTIIEDMEEINERYHVFQKVMKREDVYWGPHLDLAPQVVFVGADYLHDSDRDAELFVECPVNGHDKDGIWILSGPADAAGRQANASIMDICPTILDWMGVEPPVRPDGESLLGKLGLK